MGGMKNYRDLDAWKLAMDLAETIYELTRDFPDHERYGMTSQMRRSAVSIPSNIAEGQSRGTARLGLYFIRVALGSTGELDTQVELARRLSYLSTERTTDVQVTLERVCQMLHGMRREHQRRLLTAGATIVSALALLAHAGFFS
jgi:four helix bundle protein